MTYNLLKFLHIVGAIAWVGGLIAVAVLNARFSQREDRSARVAMTRQTRAMAAFVMMPGAILALIGGIGMMALARTGFPLWIDWGLAAIMLSILLGATVLRKAGSELTQRLSGSGEVRRLERRLALWSVINIAVLLSAVWAMVFKPAL